MTCCVVGLFLSFWMGWCFYCCLLPCAFCLVLHDDFLIVLIVVAYSLLRFYSYFTIRTLRLWMLLVSY